MLASPKPAIINPGPVVSGLLSCGLHQPFDCIKPITAGGPTPPTKPNAVPSDLTTPDPQVTTSQQTSPPPVITPQTASPPQGTDVPSVPHPKTEENPTPGAEQTSDQNAIPTSRAPPNFVLPTPSPLSLTSPFKETQQVVTLTTSSSFSNIVQSSTAGVVPPSAPEDQPTPHHRADPRIIVPVVLGIVAVAVGFAIFWVKKIKRRRAYAQEEMSEWAHGAGHGSFENRSEEHLNAVPMSSEWKAERGLTALTQRMDAIEQAIKVRVDGRKTKNDPDSQTGKLGGQDAGYGWGLGTRDDKLHGHS